MDKAEKIKAARKKLKEFQSHKKQDDDTPNAVASQNNESNEQVINETPLIPEISQPVTTGSFFDSISNDSTQIPQNVPILTPIEARSVPPATSNLFATENLESFSLPPAKEVLADFPNPSNFFSQVSQVTDDKLKDLQDQISTQSLQIAQLKSEVEFHRTTATNLQKNSEELARLKQQEMQHSDTVKVLVTEKSHLTDALMKAENIVATLKGENEELHNRLNLSRHRVKQLESMSSNNMHATQPKTPEIDDKKIEEIVNEKIREIQSSLEAAESEKSELKLLLNQKKIEMENLQKNYDHLNNELHLQSIKIAQLSDGIQPEQPSNQAQVAALSQEIAIRQQQINELNSVLDQLNREKEASETQYQNYVSAMTREMDLLKENSIELSNENNSLVKREKELLKHVSDLERQIQQQIQKQVTYAENNQKESDGVVANDEEIQKLTNQIAALSAENSSIKSQLSLHDAEKLELTKQIELKVEEVNNLTFQLERLKTETPNVSQLMVDFEDKSTAASRALTQNQSLKDQLEELQRAFINISNDKMELTDKLQSEVHLCKEMKIRHDSMESDLQAMKDKWQFKEDEMIRLSHENTELEKKILQQNIEIDRLRHYESKEYHRDSEGGGVLEKELENCRHVIDTLKNKIKVLEGGEMDPIDHSGHGHSHSHEGHGHSHNHEGHGHSHNHEGHGHSHSHESHSPKHEEKCEKKHEESCEHKPSNKHLLDEIEMLKMEKNELLKAINDFRMRGNKVEEPTVSVNGDEPEEMTDEKMKQMTIPKSVSPSMATEEALEKLQERFRRTMLEVADLTEEKNRLEHLVTQLQFETETIGEYITLYQNQRRLLKQKEHERDIQLRNLAADREMMNKKLLQLNQLIEKFVLQHTDQVEVAKEATKLLENEGLTGAEPLIISGTESNEVDFEKLKKETAGKILEILSDIKTTNTHNYDNNIGVENSCSCCYGRLETV